MRRETGMAGSGPAGATIEAVRPREVRARLRHPTDRRVRMVATTVEGRRVAARAEAALGGFRERLRALPPAELAALDGALEHLERPPAAPRPRSA